MRGRRSDSPTSHDPMGGLAVGSCAPGRAKRVPLAQTKPVTSRTLETQLRCARSPGGFPAESAIAFNGIPTFCK